MANGNFGGGTGTENDPYLVEDAFDLDAVRNNLSAHYKLVNNIDLNVVPFNQGDGWVPIGSLSSRFKGTFNGSMYTIDNMLIKGLKDYRGLFSVIEGSILNNVKLENTNISGRDNIGGLVGASYSSLISNVYINGKLNGTNNSTGGVTGILQDNSRIENSMVNVDLKSTYRAGGITGSLNNSIIDNCLTTGSIEVVGRYGGGIVGTETLSTIRNSLSLLYNASSSSVRDIGGVVGYGGSQVINSFWDKEFTKITTSNGGLGLTTTQATSIDTYIDVAWHNEQLDDGTKIWILKDGEYPKLWFEAPPIVKKRLIKVDGSTHTHNGTNWINIGQLPSDPIEQKLLFEEHGMDDITGEQIEQLKSMLPDKKFKVLSAKIY